MWLLLLRDVVSQSALWSFYNVKITSYPWVKYQQNKEYWTFFISSCERFHVLVCTQKSLFFFLLQCRNVWKQSVFVNYNRSGFVLNLNICVLPSLIIFSMAFQTRLIQPYANTFIFHWLSLSFTFNHTYSKHCLLQNWTFRTWDRWKSERYFFSR